MKGNGRWYALAFSFYPIVIGITILAGLSFGGFTQQADGVLPIAPFLAALGIALVPASFKNIGEEFGWRGYLLPRLAGTGINRWKLHLIVGAVWAGWHLPYLSTFRTFTEEGMATLVPRFFVGTIVAAVVFGEIRLAAPRLAKPLLVLGTFRVYSLSSMTIRVASRRSLKQRPSVLSDDGVKPLARTMKALQWRSMSHRSPTLVPVGPHRITVPIAAR